MGQGIPLIILHGLYGSSDNWLAIARSLSANFRVIVPDLRNHGRSSHNPEHTYQSMVADVLELMDEQTIEQCILLGHSMGGKMALHLANTAPHRISKLVIIDIAPLDYTSYTTYAPLVLEHMNIADTLLYTDLKLYNRREDIERAWMKNIPEPATRRFLLKNIQRLKNNTYCWKINIRVILQNLPHILNGMDEFDIDSPMKHPVLFVRGEHSPYIQPEVFPLIFQTFPDSQIVTIPQSGHWLHVEQPKIFLEKVSLFLSLPG